MLVHQRFAAPFKAGKAANGAKTADLFAKKTMPKRIISARASIQTTARIVESGTYTVQGTSRKQNEDRLVLDLEAAVAPGPLAAVFDGHGGNATAEWLCNGNFVDFVTKHWQSSMPEAAITKAFTELDKKILAPKGGFLGLGERGIGGSKCGSTCASVLFFKDGSGKDVFLAANIGDARTLLIRKGAPIQLSEDHVPDQEKERERIEYQNPNPKMALVRYVGGTWRVGGLLALSRAFGDAYLKGTGQFEGVQAGGDGYSSGFGVIAEPYTTVVELDPEDAWIVISSDGLYANEERGGGGGISNDDVAAVCKKMAGKSCNEIAEALASQAVKAGSTDDVTVVVLRLK